jgi:TolA-binding protein
MTSGWSAPRKALAALLLAGVASSGLSSPAAAQDDARLRRMEAELRALQRAVFPNGDSGRFFTPEVVTPTPGAQPQLPTPTTPSPGALTDVLARLDSLETQIARLTARSEESGNTLTQLQRRLEETETRLAAAQAAAEAAAQPADPLALPPLGAATPTPSPAPAAARPTPTPAPAAARPTPAPAAAVTRPAAAPAATPAAAPSAARVAAVRAIAKPQTDDAGDDEYSYGFRLWEAGYFPEARQQLALFLQRFPNHARVSYARNLLGRAYLDDGQPREAATHFFDNYQADKQAPRAADSLLYLAETMIAIGDNNRACIALAEFGETYPELALGRLQEQYDRTRNRIRCT